MTKQAGQIAEYGSEEFKNNQSVYTVLEDGVNVNSHGIERKATLYHRSAGYKAAGSCAIWTNEVYGYSIFYDDGTTGGKFSSDADYISEAWTKVNNKVKQS